MDIRLANGKPLYEFPNDVGFALVELGLASRIEKPAPPPIHLRQPRWVVTQNSFNASPQISLTKPSGEVVNYPGPMANYYGNAEQAAAAFKQVGFPIPEDFLKEYERALAHAKGEDAHRQRWD